MDANASRSLALHPLLSAAGMEAALRKPDFVVKEGEHPITTSIDLLRAFSNKYPELSADFLAGLETTWDYLLEKSNQYAEIDEPEPERVIPESLKSSLSDEDAKAMLSRKAPFTKPCSVAMKTATNEAKELDQNASIGRVIQILLREECSARAMLLEKVSVDRLEAAIDSIRAMPAEHPGVDSFMASFQEQMNKLLDKTWPEIRKVAETDRTLAFKEKHYAENPDYYRGRVNLVEQLAKPVPDTFNVFAARTGACLHAAQNEARLRNASEVTLDHMFFSLLQEGLETTKFLESKGIDWQKWREELDLAIPSYDEAGPRFPPNARNLGMNTPDHEIGPKLPSMLDFGGEGQLEKWQATFDEVSKQKRPRKFSDLLWVIPCLNEKETLAFPFLVGAGITEEDIEANIDCTY